MTKNDSQFKSKVALVVGIGLAITLLLFTMVRDWERDRLQAGFRSTTTAYLALFQSRIDFYLEELYTLQRFYHSIGNVDRGQFETFMGAVVTAHPEVVSVEWAELVPATGREAHEEKVRGEGFRDYRIQEQLGVGEMTAAAWREVHYPIRYVEPLAGNEMAIGYDIGADSERLSALQRARDSGKPVATGRMSVLPGATDQPSFLVFFPVYRSGRIPESVQARRTLFRGVVVGVFDIRATFERSVVKLTDHGIDLSIVDLNAPQRDDVIYEYHSVIDGHAQRQFLPKPGQAALSHVEHIDVGGRRWGVNFSARAQHLAYYSQWQSLAVLAMGVMLTLAVALFMVSSYRRAALVAAMVERRTQQLQDVEARQRAVLETMVDALITIDDRGIVESMNPAAERLFKYRAEEVIGNNISLLMPEPYRSEHDDYLSRYLVTNDARVIGIGREVRARRKDGSVFHAELAVSQMEIGGQIFFSGILRDISDRKLAEEQLESSYMLQNVLNLLLNTSLKRLTFDEFLTQALDIVLAMPFAAAHSRGAIFLVDEDGQSLVMRAQRELTSAERERYAGIDVNHSLCGRAAQSGRTQYVTGDEGPDRPRACMNYYCIPMVLKGTVLGVIVVFPDNAHARSVDEAFLDVVGRSMATIVDRMQAQEKLNQFKTTLDMTLDCVFMFSPDTLEFFYVNQGAVAQVGYTYDELMHLRAFDITPTLDESRFREMIQPMLSGEQPAINFETTHGHKEGSRIPVEIFLQYIHPHGESSRFVAIVRDITERKKVDRMKDEFVATVSHELRTPLTSIRGSLGLLTGGAMGALPAHAAELLDIAHKNTERLLLLINDLLDMNKLSAGQVQFKFSPIEIKSFVEQAVSANAAYAEQYHVTFQVKALPERVCMLGDSDRLMQVMYNLLSNAAKFSSAGAVVEIGAKCQEGRVRISVTDHGPGIADSFRNKIFERFTQSDSSDTRKVGGTGLGLNISRSIIERHSGRLDFESREGQGATFYFELSATQCEACDR